MAKMYASDVAMQAAIEGVRIYEGTNEIQRVVIAGKLLSLR